MTRLTDADRDRIAELYPHLAPIARRMALKFAAKFRENPDDCEADALRFILDAAIDYDPSKGSLEARVTSVVWCRLFDGWRANATRRRRTCSLHDINVDGHGGSLSNPLAVEENQLSEPLIAAPSKIRQFQAKDFCAALGEDARLVIDIFLSMPATALCDGPIRRSTRRSIADHLKSTQQWTAARIRSAFVEIADRLSWEMV